MVFYRKVTEYIQEVYKVLVTTVLQHGFQSTEKQIFVFQG